MSSHTLNEAQLTALASPVRNEVFARLCALREASVGDVARSLGRKPEAVHYHMKALVAVGLARESFKRPGVKKPEVVYEPVSVTVRLPKDNRPEIRELRRKAVAAGLRQVVRGYLEASERGGEDLHVLRVNVRLSEEDRREFFERLEAAAKFAQERRVEEGSRLMWSSVVFPVDRGSGI